MDEQEKTVNENKNISEVVMPTPTPSGPGSMKKLAEILVQNKYDPTAAMRFSSAFMGAEGADFDGIVKKLQENKNSMGYLGDTMPMEKEVEKPHTHKFALLILNWGEQVVGVTTTTKGAKDHAHLIDVDLDSKVIKFTAYTDFGAEPMKDGELRDYHYHEFECDVQALRRDLNGSIFAKPHYLSEDDTKEKKEFGKTRGTPDGTGPYGRGAGPGGGRADGTGLKKEEKKKKASSKKVVAKMGEKEIGYSNQRQAEVLLVGACKLAEDSDGAHELTGLRDKIFDSVTEDYPNSQAFNDSFVAEFADSKLDPKAKVRNRPSPAVPAADAKDNKDHFPIGSLSQARNALARVAQYDKAPSWWKGSLASLRKRVRDAVKKKYPSIKVAKLSETFCVRVRGEEGVVFINTEATELSEAREDAAIFFKEDAGSGVDVVKFVLAEDEKVEFSDFGSFMFYDVDSKGLLTATSESEVKLSEKDADGNVVIEILRTGKFNHPQYGVFEITSNKLSEIVRNFNGRVLDRDISFDFNHEPQLPAAGWARTLSTTNRNVKGSQCEVLLAHTKLTPKGEDAVKNGEFKYFSSEYVDNFIDKETGAKFGTTLKGGGLTNRPWIPGLKPIELSEKRDFAFIKNN